MFQEVSKWLANGLVLLINGVYWGYNPPTPDAIAQPEIPKGGASATRDILNSTLQTKALQAAGHGKGGSSPIDKEIQDLQAATSQLVSVVKSTNAYVEDRLPAIENRVLSLESAIGREMRDGRDRMKNDLLAMLPASSANSSSQGGQAGSGRVSVQAGAPNQPSRALLTTSSFPEYLTKGAVLPSSFRDFPVLPMSVVLEGVPASILSAICNDKFITSLIKTLGGKQGVGTAPETLLHLEELILGQKPQKEELAATLDRIKFYIYTEAKAHAEKANVEIKVTPSAKVVAKKGGHAQSSSESDTRDKIQKQIATVAFKAPK